MTEIIAPLPFTLQNGTTADASQVMADLNQIRDDVNSHMGQRYVGAVLSMPTSLTVTTATSPTVTGQLPFTTTLLDSGGISNGDGSFTVPAGVSLVRFVFNLSYNYPDTTSTPSLQFGIRKNGSIQNFNNDSFSTTIFTSDTGTEVCSHTCATVSVTPGDTYSLFCNVTLTPGHNLLIYGSGLGPANKFEMQILG